MTYDIITIVYNIPGFIWLKYVDFLFLKMEEHTVSQEKNFGKIG